jgi:hypothetical protein
VPVGVATDSVGDARVVGSNPNAAAAVAVISAAPSTLTPLPVSLPNPFPPIPENSHQPAAITSSNTTTPATARIQAGNPRGLASAAGVTCLVAGRGPAAGNDDISGDVNGASAGLAGGITGDSTGEEEGGSTTVRSAQEFAAAADG